MIGAIAGIITSLIGKGADLADQYIEDKDKAAAFKAKFQMLMMQQANSELNAKADIIKAEAQSEHKLAAIWRPILMLVIVAIVANNYILAPYAEALFGVTGLALDLPERLWDLMVVGVGGYIGGRSAEKVVDKWKQGSGPG